MKLNSNREIQYLLLHHIPFVTGHLACSRTYLEIYMYIYVNFYLQVVFIQPAFYLSFICSNLFCYVQIVCMLQCCMQFIVRCLNVCKSFHLVSHIMFIASSVVQFEIYEKETMTRYDSISLNITLKYFVYVIRIKYWQIYSGYIWIVGMNYEHESLMALTHRLV